MNADQNALVIVQPIAITDAMLAGASPASNVSEDDYPVWVGGVSATTYALGDRVIMIATHKIYESLQNTNTNNDPRTSPTWWIEVGPTNKWAVFDNSVSSQTANPYLIEYWLTPGRAIGSIGLLNLTDAYEIDITMYSPSTGSPGIVYSKTIDLGLTETASDWWSWFFAFRNRPTQSVESDLPAYQDCIVKVQIVGGADLAIGVLLIGQRREFGIGIKYGARVGIQDYSRIETNDFGDTVLIQRAFAKRVSFELMINANEVDLFQNFLASIRAKPCLYIANKNYEATVLFGFYKSFEILINYPDHADCDMEIASLT